MNAYDRDLGKAGEIAKLHYGDGEYVVLRPGPYVLCAVTGVVHLVLMLQKPHERFEPDQTEGTAL